MLRERAEHGRSGRGDGWEQGKARTDLDRAGVGAEKAGNHDAQSHRRQRRRVRVPLPEAALLDAHPPDDRLLHFTTTPSAAVGVRGLGVAADPLAVLYLNVRQTPVVPAQDQARDLLAGKIPDTFAPGGMAIAHQLIKAWAESDD